MSRRTIIASRAKEAAAKAAKTAAKPAPQPIDYKAAFEKAAASNARLQARVADLELQLHKAKRAKPVPAAPSELDRLEAKKQAADAMLASVERAEAAAAKKRDKPKDATKPPAMRAPRRGRA